jgi:hypothetical protein
MRTAARVVAIQDLDCVDRAKFRYRLPHPLPADFHNSFADADVTLRAFSRISPRARDLYTITKAGAFRCDAIAGAREFIVTFVGDAVHWPTPIMADFAARVSAAGCGTVHYVREEGAHCAGCAMRPSGCAGRSRSGQAFR